MLFIKAYLDNIRNQELLKIGVNLLKSSPVFLDGTIFFSQKARCLGADAHFPVQENQGRGVTVF